MIRVLAVIAALISPLGASAASFCTEGVAALRGDWGRVEFRVELADDAAERSRGLMFREELGRLEGMLFVYPQPQFVSFWMRNTLIPLDMLFIDESGVVRRIHENAVPLDETSIPGGPDILAVLEINGGLASEFGIDVGSELRHPAMPQAAAAWPCED